MIGAIKGIRVRLAMPENVTPERKRILAAYGAELVRRVVAKVQMAPSAWRKALC
jgi:cysteine synthase